MRMQRIALCVLLALMVPGTAFSGERRLKGRVVLVGEHDELTPAAGVSVSFKETGDPTRSKASGRFSLFLPEAFKEGERVTLLVDREGWRIQYPLEGELNVPRELEKQVVEVRLLPVGSKKFWSTDRIEKFIRDTAEKAKAQVKADGRPREIDFSRYIKEWAVQYGFSAQQAKEEIDRWVEETEQSHQDDLEKLGLAAYAKKKFAEASRLLSEAAEQKARKSQELAQEADRRARESEELALKAVQGFQLAGDASYGNYEFDKALSLYQRALQYISREKTPALWAAGWLSIGRAHQELGIRSEGQSIHKHLNAAIGAFELALEVYTRERLPQHWAATQNSLGIALSEQGRRTEGKQEEMLLEEAVAAFRRALEVYTREQSPQDWAATQGNLGNVLQRQGSRAEGAQGVKLLGGAVAAYRRALEVYTREQLPQDWARTQSNLGNALLHQGARAEGELWLKLLGEAVAAYLQALEVYTREQLPQEWARTQNSLGNALSEQGSRTEGEPGIKLLSEAVAAYRRALEVYTREQLPQDWAGTQNNLGAALQWQGIRAEGEQRAMLLGEAVAAYRRALEVYTREQLPQGWARTQNNLGNALQKQGSWTEGEQGLKLLGEAVAAYRRALEVLAREHLPQQWARTQSNLGAALSEQGSRTKGELGKKLLEEGVAALRQALEVYTPEQLSQDWTITQYNLSSAYMDLKDWRSAIMACANVLNAFPDAAEAYRCAAYLHHSKLFSFVDARGLHEQWLQRHPDDMSARADLAEAQLTTGQFVEAEASLRIVLAAQHGKSSVAVRALEIAALLAQGKIEGIPGNLEALRSDIAAQPEAFKSEWDFEGTRHFIRQDARLTRWRDWLLQLLEVMEAKDRNAMLSALEGVRARFATQPVPGRASERAGTPQVQSTSP